MKVILVLFTVLIVNFYYFPIETYLLPGVNSKMILAIIGLVLIALQVARNKKGAISKNLFSLTSWALAISLVSLVSMTINNTPDASFLTYFISMYVWLSAAYTAICCIRKVHGYLSVELVCNYLIAVCMLQCTFAILLNYSPFLDKIISAYLTGEKFMSGVDGRLHGIGCALDVGAIRFSAVSVMIAYLVIRNRTSMSTLQAWLYASAFMVLAVVGNMIGRTVTVGVGVALAYWLFHAFRGRYNSKVLRSSIILLMVLVPMLFLGYHTNINVQKHMRFGFEGFFSLYENGYWETNSNNILKSMVVFPDNTKTWIIGDGYGANPADKNSPYFDPYYLGKKFHGYYMQTDIGYLRYIYYFGLIGLIVFMGYFIAVGRICMKNLHRHKPLFLLLLCINFLVWFKVTTDIFLAFAPFLCLSKEEEEDGKEDISLKNNSIASEIA